MTAEREPFRIPIGPQHPSLKEPGHFEFSVDGEIVTQASLRLGYVHRGIEKGAEQRSWVQALYLLERVCGICSHVHATAYCLGVEKLAGVEAPPRAQAIRSLVAELERIHSHLLWLGVAAHEAKEQLHRYMDEHGIPRAGATFYAHVIPALERPSWRSNRVSGPRWVAAGDAAGLVDPVTGEGLYYAIRSGDLAAQAILHDRVEPTSRHAVYRSLLHGEFLEDLAFGAGLAKRFFIQEILFSSVPARMIELMRHSPRMRDIVQDLFAGTQRYLDLKERLLANLNGTLREIVYGAMLGHRVAKEGRQA